MNQNNIQTIIIRTNFQIISQFLLKSHRNLFNNKSSLRDHERSPKVWAEQKKYQPNKVKENEKKCIHKRQKLSIFFETIFFPARMQFSHLFSTDMFCRMNKLWNNRQKINLFQKQEINFSSTGWCCFLLLKKNKSCEYTKNHRINFNEKNFIRLWKNAVSEWGNVGIFSLKFSAIH